MANGFSQLAPVSEFCSEIKATGQYCIPVKEQVMGYGQRSCVRGVGAALMAALAGCAGSPPPSPLATEVSQSAACVEAIENQPAFTSATPEEPDAGRHVIDPSGRRVEADAGGAGDGRRSYLAAVVSLQTEYPRRC